MSLVVEDGTGKADAESYISVADADAYHLALGQTTWTGADAAKEAALRKATRYIDGRYANRWDGTRLHGRSQALMWPRGWVSDVEGFAIPTDTVPVEVVRATAEAALRELTDPGSLAPDVSSAGEIIRKKVGPLEVEYSPGTADRTRPWLQVLDDILAPILRGSSPSLGSIPLVRG